MSPAPLSLGLTQQEVAEHEAGHVVVAHIRGQNPYLVYIVDEGDGTHSGRSQSNAPLQVAGQEAAHARMLLAVACAGVLAQVKGLAARGLGTDVRFVTEQPWDALFRYLAYGSCQPPGLILRSFVADHSVTVPTAVPGAFQNDRRDIGVHAGTLRGLGLAHVAEAVAVLRETALLLDEKPVWQAVLALSQALRDAAPTLVRTIYPDTLRPMLSGLGVAPAAADRVPSPATLPPP